MPPIVRFRHVAAWRGNTRVFDDLSLDLEAGRSTVVLGPNGAGKSTLLKLLTREIHPEHRKGSSLLLFGLERWNVWDLRTRIGIVSHDLQQAFAGHWTALDAVLSGFHSSLGVWDHQRFSDADRARAREVMAGLGIDALVERPIGRLSTGEQRRTLLARALVHDPDVLVLDEPTGGLDLQGCFEYLDTMRRLMAAGKTLFLVTHHIHEIPPEIERAVLLKRGEILRDGPTGDVLTSAGLTELFDTPIEVVRANGFHRAFPVRG